MTKHETGGPNKTEARPWKADQAVIINVDEVEGLTEIMMESKLRRLLKPARSLDEVIKIIVSALDSKEFAEETKEKLRTDIHRVREIVGGNKNAVHRIGVQAVKDAVNLLSQQHAIKELPAAPAEARTMVMEGEKTMVVESPLDFNAAGAVSPPENWWQKFKKRILK